MRKLLNGLMKYRREELPQRREMFRRLAEEGQSPDTLFIACSDSRIVPNLLTSGEPGDLFTLRTIGNLIAPCDAGGNAQGDVSEAAAIEYSLVVLGIRDIVICGHSHCGAMKAVRRARRSSRAFRIWSSGSSTACRASIASGARSTSITRCRSSSS